jgi:hypothetical protein
MPKKLNKRKVEQTLRGYKLVNKITEAERHSWLQTMSIEDARKIFGDLHQNAEDWKKNDGNLRALERQRIASKVKGRKVYFRLAKARPLVNPRFDSAWEIHSHPTFFTLLAVSKF